MKKYLLFAGDNYYPNGGFDDIKMSGNSIKECIAYYDTYIKQFSFGHSCTWGHIIDRDTFEKVKDIEYLSR